MPVAKAAPGWFEKDEELVVADARKAADVVEDAVEAVDAQAAGLTVDELRKVRADMQRLWPLGA